MLHDVQDCKGGVSFSSHLLIPFQKAQSKSHLSGSELADSKKRKEKRKSIVSMTEAAPKRPIYMLSFLFYCMSFIFFTPGIPGCQLGLNGAYSSVVGLAASSAS